MSIKDVGFRLQAGTGIVGHEILRLARSVTRSCTRTRLALLNIAGLVLVLTAFVLPAPVSAAPPGTVIPNAITSVTISLPGGGNSATFVPGEVTQIDATWAVPDGTQSGDSFQLALPADFSAVPHAFVLANPVSGATPSDYGSCTVSGQPAVAICTFDSNVTGQVSVHGTLAFDATLSASESTSTTSLIFNPGINQISVPITVALSTGTGSIPLGSAKFLKLCTIASPTLQILCLIELPYTSVNLTNVKLTDTLTGPLGAVLTHGVTLRCSSSAGTTIRARSQTYTVTYNANGTDFELDATSLPTSSCASHSSSTT